MLVYQRDPEGKQQRDLEERKRERERKKKQKTKSWVVFVHETTMFSYVPSFDRMPAVF